MNPITGSPDKNVEPVVVEEPGEEDPPPPDPEFLAWLEELL